VGPFWFGARDPVELEYIDLHARHRVARGIGAVPVISRKVVRVTPPTRPAGPGGDDGTVHVADLTQPDARGGYTTEPMARLDFEARALAALPPGEASRVPLPTGVPAPGPIAEHQQVIVYGTSWCGACKDARELLAELYIDPVFVNVDTDPAGAERLAARAARVGLIVDRVPVIDVHGRLLVGFEPSRLRSLLGDSL
jgi:glutaredoxin